MAFAAFALSPRAAAGGPAPPSQPPGAVPPPLPPPHPWVPDADRDAWAATVYAQLAASPLLSPALDARLPTVPVILHPSVPRGGEPPPVTARHLGFLRVDLTGETPGPGRFFPLFPADASEAEAGVDTGSLDRFGCTGHWASSGCIRLLTAPSFSGTTPVPTDGSAEGSSSGGSSQGALALMAPDAFARLWARSSPGGSGGGSGSSGGGPSSCGSGPASGASASRPSRNGAAAPAAPSNLPTGWHVPYARLHPLEEAYGGLYRELKAAGHDLSKAHYMLRGWKTREGRPRLGGSAPRAPAGGAKAQRKGVVPAEIAGTRDLRAMINWPGLLELLEEEGVGSVPTDGVRYWLARLGGDFQARLAAAGILCAETSVHHIIARNSRGIDHPLNYFLIDRGPNSAMGSKVEGFRDANGVKLHMRDIVGERAFEVALAACNLYHGVLWAGRQRDAPLPQTLRELREGAFALAEEAMAERRQQEAKREAKRQGSLAAAAAAGACGAEGGSQSEGGADEPEQETGEQQMQQQQPGMQPRSQPRSLKRERCSSTQEQEQQEATGCSSGENAPLNSGVLSPTQQQQQQERRRRRLSGELCLVAVYEPGAAGPEAAAAAAAAAEAARQWAAGEGEAEAAEQEEVEAELAAMSLLASPEAAGQGDEEQQQQQQQLQPAALNLGSLRARLQAALGAGG